jgi:deoxyadenosine/deoxycytidine kinase
LAKFKLDGLQFYSDQDRWAFTFQTYAFLSRLRAQLRPFEDFAQRPELGAKSAASFASTPGVRPRSDEDSAAEPSAKRSKSESDADAGEAGRRDEVPALGGPEAAADDSRIIFFERSVLSDKYCFAANCRESGLFEEVEWRVYCDWWRFVLSEFRALRIDGLVYLRCSPATCHDRLQKRSRQEEAGVPLGYLKELHSRHEDWLISRRCGKDFPIPTLVLDTDEEFETDPVRHRLMIARVRSFVMFLSAKQRAMEMLSASESPASVATVADSPNPSLGKHFTSSDGTIIMGELDSVNPMVADEKGIGKIVDASTVPAVESDAESTNQSPIRTKKAAPKAAKTGSLDKFFKAAQA